MLRRAHRQRLDERDAQREAGLRVVRQALLRGGIDERVEIREAAQGLGHDRMGKRAVVDALQIARGGVERRFQRKPLAKHGVEEPERRAAAFETDHVTSR